MVTISRDHSTSSHCPVHQYTGYPQLSWWRHTASLSPLMVSSCLNQPHSRAGAAAYGDTRTCARPAAPRTSRCTTTSAAAAAGALIATYHMPTALCRLGCMHVHVGVCMRVCVCEICKQVIPQVRHHHHCHHHHMHARVMCTPCLLRCTALQCIAVNCYMTIRDTNPPLYMTPREVHNPSRMSMTNAAHGADPDPPRPLTSTEP
jgi:hypothetical protein